MTAKQLIDELLKFFRPRASGYTFHSSVIVQAIDAVETIASHCYGSSKDGNFEGRIVVRVNEAIQYYLCHETRYLRVGGGFMDLFNRYTFKA